MLCGGCTLCCTLFLVDWLKKPVNTECVHCVDNKCDIHETKPEECSGFDCMYAQHEKAPTDLRPDNINVVFEKVSDSIIFGLQDYRKEITDTGKRQIQAFLEQGFSVIFTDAKTGKNRMFVSENHDSDEVKKEFTNHLRKRYGSSNI